MRGISSLVYATDLRSFTDNDSKPEREETQQQREQQMSEVKSLRAGWQPATYYPDPAIHALDPRFEKYWLKLSGGGRVNTGVGRGRGTGVVRRRPLSPVQRHPQPAHSQMGRGNGRGQRVPQALEFRQRQHPRPPGTAGHLRAWRGGGHQNRI